jgi:DNA-binding response OmpR family regulator
MHEIVKRFGDNDAVATVVWPYSTHDEVSHLGMSDAPLLRARVDMLLEERRDLKKRLGLGEVIFPLEWKLTGQEARFLAALVNARRPDGAVSKEHIHEAMSASEEVHTELKIVDVICCRVRKKLAPYEIDVQTVWGFGYYLEADVRQRLKG